MDLKILARVCIYLLAFLVVVCQTLSNITVVGL